MYASINQWGTCVGSDAGCLYAALWIRECIREHERRHFDDTMECDPKAPPSPPDWRPGVDKYAAECDSYRAELECAKLARQRCERLFSEVHKSSCRRKIDAYIADVEAGVHNNGNMQP